MPMLGTVNQTGFREARSEIAPLRFVLLAAVSGLAAFAGLLTQFYRWGLHGIPYPFEDAAMLFRYAEVFASGGGIAFNPGEDPGVSDGATDLGFVILLAPLISFGLKPATAGFAINALAIMALGGLLAAINYQQWRLPLWVPALLGFGLGLTVASPVAGGFSSAVLGAGLVGILAWSTVLLGDNMGDRSSTWQPLVLGGAAALCGWWRPDGFILALVTILGTSLVISRGQLLRLAHTKRSTLALLAAGYGTVALLWVFFRVFYFGQLTPTSGVNKISTLNLENFEKSLYFYLVSLAWLWLIFFVTCLRDRQVRALIIFASISILFSLIWLPLDLTFNWWGRVYWPLLPVLSVFAVTLMTSGREANILRVSGRPIFTGASVALVAVTLVLLTPEPYGRYFSAPFHQSIFEVLRDMDTSGVRVATTEAGLIPLAVDEGLALDTYVHNTRAIAEMGNVGLQKSLADFSPNLLVIHGPPRVSGGVDPQCLKNFGGPWTQQVGTLYRLATESEFQELQSFTTGECDTWSIYADDSLPEGITKALAALADPFG